MNKDRYIQKLEEQNKQLRIKLKFRENHLKFIVRKANKIEDHINNASYWLHNYEKEIYQPLVYHLYNEKIDYDGAWKDMDIMLNEFINIQDSLQQFLKEIDDPLYHDD